MCILTFGAQHSVKHTHAKYRFFLQLFKVKKKIMRNVLIIFILCYNIDCVLIQYKNEKKCLHMFYPIKYIMVEKVSGSA